MQIISPYTEFVSRWLFQCVALEQTEPTKETLVSVLLQISKLWNIYQMMVYVSLEQRHMSENIYFIWGKIKLTVVLLRGANFTMVALISEVLAKMDIEF
jgi:hypothetical protein